jgi:hypothetical protein
LIFLVLLIAALLGGALLVGRRAKPVDTDDPNESVVKPRHIPKELVKFHEVRAIDVDAKRLRGLAVGADDRIYVLDRFNILVYESNGNFVRDYELDRAPHCAAFGADKNLLYLGLGRRVGVLNLATDKVTEWRDLGEQALTASIAVGDKTLMVGDSGSRTMWVFTLTGEELARISNEGAAEGEGNAPSVHFDVQATTPSGRRTPGGTPSSTTRRPAWCSGVGANKAKRSRISAAAATPSTWPCSPTGACSSSRRNLTW